MQCLSEAHRANGEHASLWSPKVRAGIWDKGVTSAAERRLLRVPFSACPTVLHQARQVCLSTDTEPKREGENVFLKSNKLKGKDSRSRHALGTAGRTPPESELIGLRRPSPLAARRGWRGPPGADTLPYLGVPRVGAVPGAQHTLPVPVLLLVLVLAPEAGRASSGGGPAWRRGEPGLPRGGRASDSCSAPGPSSALWPRIAPAFYLTRRSSARLLPAFSESMWPTFTFVFPKAWWP